MAVFRFSALSDGQSLAFNPTADVLNFDQTTVAAADLRVTQVGSNIRIDVVSGTQAGKDVTLQNVSPLQLATTNVTFADGSKLLFGDATSGTANDNLADSLTGTAGNDLLQGFGGADTMAGGAGNDTYIVSTGDVLSDSGGTDTVLSDVAWALADGFENLTLTGTGNISATGNNATNILVGNSGNNFFNPRAGDDTILAGAGNDLVRLGGGGLPSYGNKVIDGGAGTDQVEFGGFAKSAIVVDLTAGTLKGGGDAGQGSATLISIESVVGDAFDDKITGSGSTESLGGGGGNDTLDGRGGADTLTGGLGADTFVFTTIPFALDTDRVTDFVSATDKLSFDNAVFNALGAPGNFAAGDARFAAGAGLTSGQDASDRLIYNTTTGQLFYDADGNGSGGSVRVATLQGAPALVATDIVVTGQFGSAIQGTAGNDTLTGTPGNDTIDGLGGNDVISGLDAADSLIGGGGNDTLDGGAGIDTMSGGLGADTFAFTARPGAGNADQVTDFVSAADKLSFDNSVFTTMGPAGSFTAGDPRFVAGPGFTSAQGAEDRLVYNTTTGELFYTPRGDLESSLLVAKLQGAPALTASDIVVTGRAAIEGTPGNDSLTGTPLDDSISGLAGNDTLDGRGGQDTLRGGDGDDTLIDHVNGGSDTVPQFLDGGLGNDTYDLLASPFDFRPGAVIVDAGGVDTVLANHDFIMPDGIENLTLFEGLRGTGNAQNNIINTVGSEFGLHQVDAREGNDTIIGGPDRDEMTGGQGNDTFVFRLVPHPVDATGQRVQSDQIEDFASGADRLQFDNNAFTELGGAGNFAAGDARFASGAGLTSGRDASDRLVYDTTNGDLYYDADGSGAGASVLVAHLTGAPALVASDISVTGQSGPGTIQGTEGNDTLTGTAGNDTIDGRGGNDLISGLAGADSLIGGAGNDTLDGGAGTDTLDGGLGDDTYVTTSSRFQTADQLVDAGGTDTLIVNGDGAGAGLPDGFENLTYRGTAATFTLLGDSELFGNAADNVIRNESVGSGFFMNGGAGNDTLIGSDHEDWFEVSAGNDVVDGGADLDRIVLGGAGVVDLRAGTATTASGNMTFLNIEGAQGGGFADRLVANDSGNELLGGGGNDTILGGAGNDTLVDDFDRRGDSPTQPIGDDSISGGAGDDTIIASRGNDTVQGGAGNDHIIVDNQDSEFGQGADTDSIDGGDGIDTLETFSDADVHVDLAAGTLTSRGSQATVAGIENFSASHFVNTGPQGPVADIRGDSGVNVLIGNEGADTLDGRGGNDTLTGDIVEFSTIPSAGGADHFVFDQTPGAANADVITDFHSASDTLDLDASVMAQLGASGRFAAGDARFFAASGATGGHDADDRVVYDTSTGNVYYDADGSGAGSGQLVATLQGAPTLAATDITVVGGAGTPGAHIVGTAGNDTLNGTAGNDTVDGLGGDDVLAGGLGADILHGGDGNDRLKDRDDSNLAAPDTLDGGLGDDIYDFLASPLHPHSTVIVDAGGVDTVWSNHDFVLPAGIENLTLFEGKVGTGNELGNMMVSFGNVGAYTMDGAGGNDTLVGAPNSNDLMTGGAGNDVFAFTSPSDPVQPSLDTLSDFVSGTDRLQFDNAGFTQLGGAGNFAPRDARFASGAGLTSGQDASDRLVYNTSTGDLFYDADGNGVGASVLVAHLSGAPALAATDIVVVGAAAPGSNVINGTAGNDSLTGTEGSDIISGLAGNDTINGLGGEDTLDGGPGVDNLNGGLDSDAYIVTAGDVLSDTGGIDTVFSDISWALADGFENLTLTGTANISATGNNAANLIVGNSGNNFFNPRGGDDFIEAGAGNDTIRLGGGGVPSYGNKVINGEAGFDTLDFGGFARSAIAVDLAAGTLSGGGDAGQGSATLIGIESVVGDGFNDRISGSAVAESLNGGGGNDTINGRGGNDALTGGLGADTFVFDTAPAAGNVDQVTDFVSASDRLNFDNATFTALGADGNFAAADARFAAGAGFTSGRDASDRIVYDTATGNLYYDADGSGTEAAQLVATLQGHPALAATDISVI